MQTQSLIMSRSNYSVLHFSLCILALVLMTGECFAAAQLMITPTRVIFDGNTRNAKVTLINTGDSTGTYRIGLVNKRMTVDGNFEDIKEARNGELFADKMIRYSPRQVVLEPGKSQVVRLSLRKPRSIKDGEYRSHILFKAIPQDAGADINAVTKSDKISIKLTAIVSISIPVIIRHGKTSIATKISSIKFQPAEHEKDKPKLVMEITRSGNQSVYGDLLAEFIQEGGTSTILGQVNGVAVYTPNEKRVFKMPINVPAGQNLRNGVIKVYYRDSEGAEKKVLTHTKLKLP